MAGLFITLSIVFFGVGTFLGKMALENETPIAIYIFEGIGTLTVVAVVALWFWKDTIVAMGNINWIGYAFGICYGLGTVTFIMALKHWPASIVTPLSTLYVVITVILAIIFLGEAITLKTGIGIACALAAVFFLTQ